jgi:hypothetical protein
LNSILVVNNNPECAIWLRTAVSVFVVIDDTITNSGILRKNKDVEDVGMLRLRQLGLYFHGQLFGRLAGIVHREEFDSGGLRQEGGQGEEFAAVFVVRDTDATGQRGFGLRLNIPLGVARKKEVLVVSASS